MIYIRTDMNATVATGHVMRCLSIADAVRELGEETVFLVADEEPVEFLRDRGYASIVLQSDWRNMDGELPILMKVIEDNGIKELFIDSYQVTQNYLQTLKKHIKVCYLDDLNRFEYPVDTLICYDNYYEKFDYPSRLQDVKLYLGMQYAPLRAVFRNCPVKQISPRAMNLLLLSGGTDPYHILKRLLNALAPGKRSERWKITVICGGMNQDYEQIRSDYEGINNVSVFRQVNDIENYMQEADIAVSAGGSTLYELCACGTPAIAYAFADNQLENVWQFAEEGLIPYAGDLRKDDVIGNVVRLLEDLRDDQKLREERSVRMQNLIDGRGALRIAQVLVAQEKTGRV